MTAQKVVTFVRTDSETRDRFTQLLDLWAARHTGTGKFKEADAFARMVDQAWQQEMVNQGQDPAEPLAELVTDLDNDPDRIYTIQEMAKALRITVAELAKQLDPAAFGNPTNRIAGLKCHHSAENVTQFSEAEYTANRRAWRCVQTLGGHFWNRAKGKGLVLQCSVCGQVDIAA